MKNTSNRRISVYSYLFSCSLLTIPLTYATPTTIDTTDVKARYEFLLIQRSITEELTNTEERTTITEQSNTIFEVLDIDRCLYYPQC